MQLKIVRARAIHCYDKYNTQFPSQRKGYKWDTIYQHESKLFVGRHWRWIRESTADHQCLHLASTADFSTWEKF